MHSYRMMKRKNFFYLEYPSIQVAAIFFIAISCGTNEKLSFVSGFTYPSYASAQLKLSSQPLLPNKYTLFSPPPSILSFSPCSPNLKYGFRKIRKPSLREATNTVHDESSKTETKHEYNPFNIYKTYMRRLWNDTSDEARYKISKDKARFSIRKVLEMFSSEKYLDYVTESGKEAMEARDALINSCDTMLEIMDSTDGKMEAKKKSLSSSTSTESKTNGASSTMHSDAHMSTNHLGNKDSRSETVVVNGHHQSNKDENIDHYVNEGSMSLTNEVEKSSSAVTPKKKKPGRSILFGACMGAFAAFWVFSGSFIFTTLFTLVTAMGQLEYYRMVMNKGIYPARKISLAGACIMFVTALIAPDLHQIVLPSFGTLAMLWLLTMRRQTSTIADIATTFTGMFYLGYIPSFWVRARTLGATTPTQLFPIIKPILEKMSILKLIPKSIQNSIQLPITVGSAFIFWTWLCIAFSDVGAYFFGKNMGKTKLGQISPAAGATSPNKTVEGALGGCFVSAVLATIGAWTMKWPLWYITGPLHGVNLGLLGLVGDLTASMLKRDAGLKDYGDLLPEHGGILDRVDSFIFTAPYSWLVCAYAIPFISRIVA